MKIYIKLIIFLFIDATYPLIATPIKFNSTYWNCTFIEKNSNKKIAASWMTKDFQQDFTWMKRFVGPFGWSNSLLDLPFEIKTYLIDKSLLPEGKTVIINEAYFRTSFNIEKFQLNNFTSAFLSITAEEKTTIFLNGNLITKFSATSTSTDPYSNQWAKKLGILKSDLVIGENILAVQLTAQRDLLSEFILALQFEFTEEKSNIHLASFYIYFFIILSICLTLFAYFLQIVIKANINRNESVGVKLLERDVVHRSKYTFIGKRFQTQILLILQVWEFVVLLSFCFSANIPWPGTATYGFSVISLDWFVLDFPASVDEGIFLRFVFFFPLLVLNACKIFWWKEREEFRRYRGIVVKCNKFFLDIGLIPTLRLVLFVGSCEYNDHNGNTVAYLTLDKNQQCWTPSHTLLVVIDIFIFGCFNFISLDYKVKKKLQTDTMAFERRYLVTLISVKVLLCIISSMDSQFQQSALFVLSTLALFSLILFVENLVLLPCVSPKFHAVNYSKSATFAGVLWGTANSILIVQTHEFINTDDILTGFLLGLPLVMITSALITKKWSDIRLSVNPTESVTKILVECSTYVYRNWLNRDMSEDENDPQPVHSDRCVEKIFSILDLLVLMLDKSFCFGAKRIVKSGILKAIAQISDSPIPEIAEPAKDFIVKCFTLTDNDIVPHFLVDYGGLLFSILSDNLEPKKHYIEAISQLGALPAMRYYVKKSNIIENLLEVDYPYEVNCSSVIILLRFAEVPQTARVAHNIVKSNVELVTTKLIQLLESNNPYLILDASLYLLKIKCEKFVKIGSCLKKCFKSDSIEVQIVACDSLRKFMLFDGTLLNQKNITTLQKMIQDCWDAGLKDPDKKDLFFSAIQLLEHAHFSSKKSKKYLHQLLNFFRASKRKKNIQWLILEAIESLHIQDPILDQELLHKLNEKNLDWTVAILKCIKEIGTKSVALQTKILSLLESPYVLVVTQVFDLYPMLDLLENGITFRALIPCLLLPVKSLRDKAFDLFVNFPQIPLNLIWNQILNLLDKIDYPANDLYEPILTLLEKQAENIKLEFKFENPDLKLTPEILATKLTQYFGIENPAKFLFSDLTPKDRKESPTNFLKKLLIPKFKKKVTKERKKIFNNKNLFLQLSKSNFEEAKKFKLEQEIEENKKKKQEENRKKKIEQNMKSKAQPLGEKKRVMKAELQQLLEDEDSDISPQQTPIKKRKNKKKKPIAAKKKENSNKKENQETQDENKPLRPVLKKQISKKGALIQGMPKQVIQKQISVKEILVLNQTVSTQNSLNLSKSYSKKEHKKTSPESVETELQDSQNQTTFDSSQNEVKVSKDENQTDPEKEKTESNKSQGLQRNKTRRRIPRLRLKKLKDRKLARIPQQSSLSFKGVVSASWNSHHVYRTNRFLSRSLPVDSTSVSTTESVPLKIMNLLNVPGYDGPSKELIDQSESQEYDQIINLKQWDGKIDFTRKWVLNCRVYLESDLPQTRALGIQVISYLGNPRDIDLYYLLLENLDDISDRVIIETFTALENLWSLPARCLEQLMNLDPSILLKLLVFLDADSERVRNACISFFEKTTGVKYVAEKLSQHLIKIDRMSEFGAGSIAGIEMKVGLL